MASFSIAKDFTKDLEGGFWNDPSAGWTYAGITRNNFPAWPGFRRLLQLSGGKTIPRYTVYKDATLLKMVDDFYRVNHWNKYTKGDAINTQAIANFIYDFIVHKQNAAIAVINASARALDATVSINPYEVSSGVVGVANRFPAQFYSILYNNRINYYKNGKFSAPYKAAFIKRVQRFPEVLTTVIN